MSEWKAGDIVGLRVDLAESDAVSVVVSRAFGTTITTPVMNEYIEPLPTPDPHQALKDAVIEAAKGYMKEGADVALYRELREAVGVLIAAQTPPKPDPVEVFYEVAGDNLCVCSSKTWKLCRSKPDECACRHYIAEGLAAVEAARGAK